MKFIPVEFTILCNLLLLLLLNIGYLIYSRIKKGRDRTQIFLEVTNGQDSVQMKLLSLRYAPDYYSFHSRYSSDPRMVNVNIEPSGRYEYNESKLGLRVFYKLLHKAHCITLLIFNRNSELVDIVLLRSLYSPVMGSTGQSDHCDRGAEAIDLYPNLPKN